MEILYQNYIELYTTLVQSYMVFASHVVGQTIDLSEIEYGKKCVETLNAMYFITSNYSDALIKMEPSVKKLMEMEVKIYDIFETLGCF